MDKRKLLLTSASLLLVTFLTGCNNPESKKVSNREKLSITANAAMEKVDKFNNDISQINTSETETDLSNVSLTTSNDNINTFYMNNTKSEYCENQSMCFYIFNNIYYGVEKFYLEDNIPLGTVITGKTRRMPDNDLQKYYDDSFYNFPDSTLSLWADVSGDDDTYVVDFKADWDLRNEFFYSNAPKFYSAILTTGKMIYKNGEGIRQICLNSYWMGQNRNFISCNMDYDTNTFTQINANVNMTSSKNMWDEQDDPSKEIADLWNSGNLKATDLFGYLYNYYDAYSGKITSNLDGFVGKKRILSEAYQKGDTITEGTDNGWKDLMNQCYAVNKAAKIRTHKDMLDLTNAVSVDIDKTVKYGEAKTKLYWLYEEVGGYYRYGNKALIPYIEKDKMIEYMKTLKLDQTLSADQKTLVNEYYDYLSKISVYDYFGEVDTDDICLVYDYNGTKNNRYNTYCVYRFSYKLFNKKNPDVVLEFTIIDGKITPNSHIGDNPKERDFICENQYTNVLEEARTTKATVDITSKPDKLIDNQSAKITGKVVDKKDYNSIAISVKLDGGSTISYCHAPLRTDGSFEINVINYDFKDKEKSVIVNDFMLHYDTWLTHEIEFDSKGGTSIPSQSIFFSKRIPESCIPTKDGYRFVGWYQDEAYEVPWFLNGDAVSQNSKVYAKWIDKDDPVTLDIGYAIPSLTIEAGEKLDVTIGKGTETSSTPKAFYVGENIAKMPNSTVDVYVGETKKATFDVNALKAMNNAIPIRPQYGALTDANKVVIHFDNSNNNEAITVKGIFACDMVEIPGPSVNTVELKIDSKYSKKLVGGYFNSFTYQDPSLPLFGIHCSDPIDNRSINKVINVSCGNNSEQYKDMTSLREFVYNGNYSGFVTNNKCYVTGNAGCCAAVFLMNELTTKTSTNVTIL